MPLPVASAGLSVTIQSPAPAPRWFWGALVLLHLAALLFQLQQRYYLFPDSDRYLTEAENIVHHGEFYARPPAEPRHPQEYTMRPPGYPLWLAALGTPAGYVAWALLAQNVLSLLNLAWITRLVGRYAPPAWGWWLLLTVTFPGQIIYANVLMSELLLQTAVVGIFASAVACWERPRARHFAALAGWATLAMFVKPVFYPFSALVLAAGLWAAWRQRRAVLAALGALPLVLALLYQGWNAQRTGYFHFSSIAEINLLRYNVRAVLRKVEGPEAADRHLDAIIARAGQQPGYAAEQRYIKAESSRLLRQHLGAYALIHAQGSVNFFLDPGRFDVVHFLGLPEPPGAGLLARFSTAGGYRAVWAYVRTLPVGLIAGLLLVAAANALRLLLLLRFLLDRLAPLHLRVLVAGLLGYVAVLTGPLGAARFAVPVLPLLLVAVPFALARWPRLSGPPRRGAAEKSGGAPG
ncbi:hypothetical protein [Hymenobacter sp. B81]|uniref:hypothetical protein n=1 Tax=Hymenobacter sp. B81 TaxID=3344878 RepID=UPI0037DD3699